MIAAWSQWALPFRRSKRGLVTLMAAVAAAGILQAQPQPRSQNEKPEEGSGPALTIVIGIPAGPDTAVPVALLSSDLLAAYLRFERDGRGGWSGSRPQAQALEAAVGSELAGISSDDLRNKLGLSPRDAAEVAWGGWLDKRLQAYETDPATVYTFRTGNLTIRRQPATEVVRQIVPHASESLRHATRPNGGNAEERSGVGKRRPRAWLQQWMWWAGAIGAIVVVAAVVWRVGRSARRPPEHPRHQEKDAISLQTAQMVRLSDEEVNRVGTSVAKSVDSSPVLAKILAVLDNLPEAVSERVSPPEEQRRLTEENERLRIELANTKENLRLQSQQIESSANSESENAQKLGQLEQELKSYRSGFAYVQSVLRYVLRAQRQLPSKQMNDGAMGTLSYFFYHYLLGYLVAAVNRDGDRQEVMRNNLRSLAASLAVMFPNSEYEKITEAVEERAGPCTSREGPEDLEQLFAKLENVLVNQRISIPKLQP